MMSDNKMRQYFLLVLGSFVLSAVSVLLLPFSTTETAKLTTIGYISGALFWIGMLVGITGYIVLYRKNKEIFSQEEKKGGLPSVLCFFNSELKKIVDGVFLVAAAGTVYCAVNIQVNQILAVILIFLLILSIYLHCLFSGMIFENIYKQIKLDEKRKVQE